MNIYDTLLYLATDPFENKLGLKKGLTSSDAVLNELEQELNFSFSDDLNTFDIRQANETMVFGN